MLNLKKLKNLPKMISSDWFFIFIAIASLFFVLYKSIYQSDRQLNDLPNIIILIILFGLTFSHQGKWSDRIGIILIFLLFLSPLYWLWRHAHYDTSVIAGILPIGDPLQYYGDALRLHYGFPLSALSSRRPLFMGFLSVILKFTGDNLQITLIILAILVTLAVAFLALELKKTFGATTAMTVVTIVYYCYKGHGYIGKTYTEQLGLLLGTLSLALFIQGIRLKKNAHLLLGLLTLTLALNARAGAFFIIPAIIIWKAFDNENHRFSLRQFVFFSFIALLGFALNFLVLKVIGNSQGVPFENLGSTMYGLVTGYRGWTSLYLDHPNVRDAGAWPHIVGALQQHPENFVLGIFRAYADFFTPNTMFQFLYFSPGPQRVSAYFLYVCSLVGLIRLVRMSGKNKSFLLFSLGGIFLSIPFVPPSDEGIRALTATMPFFALLPAIAFSKIHQIKTQQIIHDKKQIFVTGFTLAIIMLVILGPLMIWAYAKPVAKVANIVCPQDTTPVSMWVSSGSLVRLVSNDSIQSSLVPNLRVKDIRLAIQKNEFDYFDEGSSLLRNLESGKTILIGHNLFELSHNPDTNVIWLIAPTHQVHQEKINFFCTRLLAIDNFGSTPIFSAESAFIP